MRPFTSFYDPKGLDPAMNASQIMRLEGMIAKEVEIALKQVRSAKNLSTKVKKSKLINDVLIKQLDLIENQESRRYSSSAEEKAEQEYVRSEVLKLVPENYRLAILPAQFTYTDGERIRRMMADMAQEFMLNSSSTSK